jgi:hypothetical protein
VADTTRFWDRLSDKYYQQPIADEESYRTKLEVTPESVTGLVE